ncbi:hypothetical protein BS47DRAFT_1148807 [Hydnum rufescens UP504]|uniref:Uncharacterized protein n=1 Tax=Hydnum rufescens UP504 TaxID=1448309 RepID=A0A9P6DZF4_9AGAM|nr:hypothetical protein BS47DRAFT_1148807 [Hydnum rufescens UP504]
MSPQRGFRTWRHEGAFVTTCLMQYQSKYIAIIDISEDTILHRPRAPPAAYNIHAFRCLTSNSQFPMPPRSFQSVRGAPGPSSPSRPDAAASSGSAATPSTRLRKGPVPQNPPPLQRTYPEYIDSHFRAPGWDAAVAAGSILAHIPALPLSIGGPLRQVVDVVSEIIQTIDLMHQNRNDCAHLINRVVKFLQSLVDDLRRSKVPIRDSWPTTTRLFALRRCVFHRHWISSLYDTFLSAVAT